MKRDNYEWCDSKCGLCEQCRDGEEAYLEARVQQAETRFSRYFLLMKCLLSEPQCECFACEGDPVRVAKAMMEMDREEMDSQE